MPDYEDLLTKIKEHCAKNCLVPTEAFLFRCIQIYEVIGLGLGLGLGLGIRLGFGTGLGLAAFGSVK